MGRDLAAAYAHCEASLKADDYEAWLASLFVPAACRPQIQALRAAFLEFSRVRDRVKQPMAGELRLQWWLDALAGEARGDAEASPLAAALLDALDRRSLPREPIAEAIESHRVELYGEPLHAIGDLQAFFATTQGNLTRLECLVLTEGLSAEPGVADPFGIARGVTNLLGSLWTGKPRTSLVPDVLLAQAHVARADLEAGQARLDAVADALRTLVRQHLGQARSGRSRSADAAAPAFLSASLLEPRLRLSERQPMTVHAGLALPRWRAQWILWRAARRGSGL